jgi:hypothetical protein
MLALFRAFNHLQVFAMGIAKYNQHCRSIVTRYTKEWERTVTRIGRWIDFKNDYKTLGMRVGGLGLPSALSRVFVNFLFCLSPRD